MHLTQRAEEKQKDSPPRVPRRSGPSYGERPYARAFQLARVPRQ